MIDIKLLIGIFAGTIGALSFIPYFRDIFLHKTKPHIYTWLIWSLLQGTSVFIMLYGGAGIGVLPFVIGTILCGSIFILSLKYGTKNITLFDTICLIGALVALIFYIFLHNSLLSIILVSIIDFIGFIPTFRKSYVEPKTETASTYIVSAVSSVLAIGALLNYSVITILYPATLILTDTTCWLIIVLRRKK
jgi:uncharacterized protein with PQ loop repeat